MTKAMTVRGPIDGDRLGVVLPHEHVIIDLSFMYQESSVAGMGTQPVGTIDPKVLRVNPTVSKDNLVLDDPDLSVIELEAFKAVGGSSVVDLTLPGLGRNPRILQEISTRSGVNILCGTGWNAESTHPQLVKQGSVDDLAKVICSELTTGIKGTPIRAGIIGEIGITGPMTQGEEKVLRAAGRSQEITGAAIVIDTLPLQDEKYAFKALEILEEGSDLSRIVVAHVDFDDGLDGAYVSALLNRGVYVELDGFGTERPDYSEWLQRDSAKLMLPTDAERVKMVRELTENGYSGRVLLSHDTCMKWEYRTYGGVGYGHILRKIVPALMETGVGKNEIDTMLIDNPKRLLAYIR